MTSQNVNALFQGALDDGTLGAGAMAAIGNIPDMGAQIQMGLGISVDDVTASEVTLVTMMPDDSGSIRFVAGNTEAVREGCNTILDALGASKQKDGILVHNRYLNGNTLFPYTTLDQAVRMDASNYNPNQGTPLYDQTAVLLATVLAKAREFEDNGVACRTVTAIITDGADEHSRSQSAASIKKIVTDMLRMETHIILFMGIADGYTDFQRVAAEMGIPSEFVLTPKNSPSEIRKAFMVVSQSAVRASQGGAAFSKVALGGFGA